MSQSSNSSENFTSFNYPLLTNQPINLFDSDYNFEQSKSTNWAINYSRATKDLDHDSLLSDPIKNPLFTRFQSEVASSGSIELERLKMALELDQLYNQYDYVQPNTKMVIIREDKFRLTDLIEQLPVNWMYEKNPNFTGNNYYQPEYIGFHLSRGAQKALCCYCENSPLFVYPNVYKIHLLDMHGIKDTGEKVPDPLYASNRSDSNEIICGNCGVHITLENSHQRYIPYYQHYKSHLE